MKDLAWVDSAFGEPTRPGPRWKIEPVDTAICKNCGVERKWKYICFDFCRYCVREAHQ